MTAAQRERATRPLFDLIRDFTNSRREQVRLENPEHEALERAPSDEPRWVTSASLWDLLVDNMARAGGVDGASQRSRPPVSTEVLSIVDDIRDSCVDQLVTLNRKPIWNTRQVEICEHIPHRPDSQIMEMWRDIPAELRAINAAEIEHHRFTKRQIDKLPKKGDAARINDRVQTPRDWWEWRMEEWIAKAKAALGEVEPRIKLPRGMRCLDCNASSVQIERDGDVIRDDALNLVWRDDGSLHYFECRACGVSHWPADLHSLAEHQQRANLSHETLAE